MTPCRLTAVFGQLVQGRGTLIKNFTWVMGLRGIQQGLGLVGYYFLTRGLTTDTFGTYGFFLSVLAYCTIVTLPGLNGAVTQCTARGKSGIFRHALRISLTGSLAGSLVCLGAWIYYGTRLPHLASAFLLAALLFPASHGMLQWQSVLSGKEKYSSLFWLGSLTSVMTYGAIIAGVHLVPDEILVPVVAVIVAPAVVNILMTIRMFRLTRAEATDTVGITYGLKSSVHLAINTIANHLDKLLLFHFLSAEAVALYMVAERLSEFAKNVVQDVAAVLVPRFARLATYTKQLDYQLRLVGLFCSAGILALSFTILPWGIVLIFSERYADTVPIAQGLMVSVAIGLHATLRARYVTSKLDSASFRDIYFTISIARIVFTSLLVPFFGLWGAVGSAIVYRLVSNVVVHFVIFKRHLSEV